MNTSHFVYVPNKNNKDCIAIIGTFDGIHLGHKKLILTAKKDAVKKGYHFVIVTFNPDPKNFLNKEKSILSFQEKLMILKEFKPDEIIIFNFSNNLKNTNYKDFNNYLKKYHIKKIYAGNDFKYGQNTQGNINTLKEDFDVVNISYKTIKFKKISSTLISKILENGNISKANKLLGYSYFIYAKVIKGHKISKTLNFPTANLEIDLNKLLPKTGVYYANCQINSNKIYKAAVNIGFSPTIFKNNKKIKVEAYILDFNEDIYDNYIKISFLKFIRPEIKFDSKEQLSKQIANDIKIIRNKK